ncbi:MAG: hypothetical protein K0Q59_4768 [Paenibacillus sp.]|jgi:protein-tyrosine phosphatase|nr:hypothetical protein [Paenibacillus sp.]
MIDIHCHILSGIDDGAKSVEESVEMARLAYEDGIRHIIATPHFTSTLLTYRDIVAVKMKQLQSLLNEQKIGITLHPGHEVRLESASFIERHIEERSFFYLGAPENFILFEQRWSDYDPAVVDLVQLFVGKGIIPIIPHPERHDYFRKQPELLTQLVEAGAWTQVSVDSMLGKNNEAARDFAFQLFDQDIVHTIATDAHNTNRKPNLSEGYRLIAERYGQTRVQQISERIQRIIG